MNLDTRHSIRPLPARSATALPAVHIQPEVDSQALLAGHPCIAIRHGKDVYWLRATRQGKLLLTK